MRQRHTESPEKEGTQERNSFEENSEKRVHNIEIGLKKAQRNEVSRDQKEGSEGEGYRIEEN